MTTTLYSDPTGCNRSFHAVADSFLQDDGLPFADVLSAQSIEQAFGDRDALFGQDEEDIFSTQIVLWAFRTQSRAIRDSHLFRPLFLFPGLMAGQTMIL